MQLLLKAKVAITPEGVMHDRSFTVGGASVGSGASDRISAAHRLVAGRP